MTRTELAQETRRQNRLERLGSNTPRCGTCGEDDDRCLEAHHIAGRKHDDTTVCICRNCHRKVSDDQRGYPPVDATADFRLDSIGRFLLGLADLLSIILEKLTEFGNALIERALDHSLEVAR